MTKQWLCFIVTRHQEAKDCDYIVRIRAVREASTANILRQPTTTSIGIPSTLRISSPLPHLVFESHIHLANTHFIAHSSFSMPNIERGQIDETRNQWRLRTASNPGNCYCGELLVLLQPCNLQPLCPSSPTHMWKFCDDS